MHLATIVKAPQHASLWQCIEAHLLLVKHDVHGAFKAVAVGPQRPSHQHLDAAGSEVPLR